MTSEGFTLTKVAKVFEMTKSRGPLIAHFPLFCKKSRVIAKITSARPAQSDSLTVNDALIVFCYFVTCDFVTLRGFMICEKSRSRILLLYYNIIIILIYTILHFLEGLNVTKSHVTKAQMTSTRTDLVDCLA